MTFEFAYNGEYKDLIDWITDSYSPAEYKTFTDWLKDVKLDFHNNSKHFSDDIAQEMKQLWIDNELGALGYGTELPTNTATNRTYNQVRTLQLFTLKDIYDKNESRPKASIRRELQTLVKKGRLERVKKGVYRVK